MTQTPNDDVVSRSDSIYGVRTARIQVLMSEDYADRLKAAALADDRTVSDFARVILQEWLDRHRPQQ